MQTTLSTLRSSRGLIIGTPLLERLRVDKKTAREARTNGETLFIRLLRQERRDRARTAADRTDHDRAKASGKQTRRPPASLTRKDVLAIHVV